MKHSLLLIIGFTCSPFLSFSLAQSFVTPEVPEGWTYHHDLEIGMVDDTLLTMELVAPHVAPDQPLPVLIYIHGGGWNHGSKDDHANRIAGIARRGYVAASLMYRFAPQHPYPAQIEDIQAAIRYLKAHAATHHLDPDRINLWGTSAGAHLASLAGTAANDIAYSTHGLWEDQYSTIFSVVDFSGPNSGFLTTMGNNSSSLTAFLGGRSQSIPEIAAEAMPITHVDANDPPFFVAHGDADTTVPVAWGRDFATALQNAGGTVEYHEFSGGTHGLSTSHPESQDLAYAFLRRLNFPDLAGFPKYEAEDWILTVSTGTRTSPGTDALASGGAHIYYKASALGDWIELELGSLPAGNYRVIVSGKTHTARGAFQLSIAGQNIGSTIDQYASSSAFTSFDTGIWSWEGGTANARFTITGRNDQSTNYQISLDSIEFISIDPEPDTWAGYPIIETNNGFHVVNTGAFLGNLWISGNWAYSSRLTGWIYLPETYVAADGAWTNRPHF